MKDYRNIVDVLMEVREACFKADQQLMVANLKNLRKAECIKASFKVKVVDTIALTLIQEILGARPEKSFIESQVEELSKEVKNLDPDSYNYGLSIFLIIQDLYKRIKDNCETIENTVKGGQE